ncbi:MAG: YceI family protein [Bdellovibrionales bacterium]|nr:YceI family protein [Bdellovibrionales bacterium]
MKSSLLIIVLLTSRFLGAATFEVSEALMAFTALATPGALKILGKQSDPKAIKTKIIIHGQQMSGTASLQLVSLSTGIDLRDKHMKEKYLETDKFPQAIFTFKKLTLPNELTGEKIPFDGTMNLHGVEKPISGYIRLEKKESALTITHEFKIKTGDFGITTPHFMSVTMGQEVVVKVILEGNLKGDLN